ncbi:hypothetical protein B0J13DRAFT_529859 [Dactylonectria estremocensis]|uniref:Uncharacterized protein n=1 Tax=Dactylonectria estremocensis TaxID=1079267 RepID=A0A9P9ISQ8_9HYPO|nr:hypothetical protein B0J13DRAFT_529859 [Dactylonectria estremocensis]
MGSSKKTQKPERKHSGRSHEENQERAYIAASRRTDRSLDARVQSARMASAVHKKRTGKALRITEATVINEEVYEEEDDGFPRSFQLLGRPMPTTPARINSLGDASRQSRLAMFNAASATEQDWRENEVNQAFAQFFPQVHQNLARRWSTPRASMSSVTLSDQLPHTTRISHAPGSQHFIHHHGYDPLERSASVPAASKFVPSQHHTNQYPPPLTNTSGSLSDSPRSQASGFLNETLPAPNVKLEPSTCTPDFYHEAPILVPGIVQPEALNAPMCDPQNVTNGLPVNNFYGWSEGVVMDEPHQSALGVEAVPSIKWNQPTRPIDSTEEFPWDRFINDGAS